GDHLYLGAFDSPDLVVVDLGTSGAPTAVHTLTLEGAGGITRVAATGNVPFSGVSGFLRFVYAIGQDQAIHGANATPGRPLTECEPQLDTRYLHDFPSQSTLPCFPIGSSDPRFHRRANARGPGIRLPPGVLPLDISIMRGFDAVASVDNPNGPP